MSRATSVAVSTVAAVALLLVAPPAPPASATPPAFTTLQPGQPAHLTETVPIQVVLVGYDEDVVPPEILTTDHLTTNRPIVRAHEFYGVREELGLEYSYDYEFVYADRSYEDDFFGYLTSIAEPQVDHGGYDETFFQFLYNIQGTNLLEVEDAVVLDSIATERWLLEHPAPGIDPARDTVVFVNWWGRDDFRFHTYRQPPGPPASGTTLDPSLAEESAVIAGGGTSPSNEDWGFGVESRLWFHDLSAGPDFRSAGWAIDTNLGIGYVDPALDYVMPPVWEYLLPGGARPTDQLAYDLWSLTRFVATNYLFTPSPLYAPWLNDHRLPTDVELDVEIYNDLASSILEPAELHDELTELLGPVAMEVDGQRFDGGARRCHDAWASRSGSCHPQHSSRYGPLANLFLWAEHEQGRWRDGSAEHEAPAFVFSSTPGRPYLGFADDNHQDGHQSAVYSTPIASDITSGVSPTETLIHEYGHYFGLSHPHDGWEPELGGGFAYGGSYGGEAFFTWVGDEVSSTMNYLFTTEDFSQFDHDNRNRWMAAAYLRSGNAIAADVLASPRAGTGAPALVEADAAFTAAQAALTAHDYPRAHDQARAGYLLVRQAATAARVAVPASDDGFRTLPPGRRTGQLPQGAVEAAHDPTDAIVRIEATRPDLATSRDAAG